MLAIRTILLCVALANGAILAGLIAQQRQNHSANIVLASLILLVTARLGPYALGFAGLYDAYRWLTFLPLDLSLAFGPLFWAYVLALTGGSLKKLAPHLVPAAIQLIYWCACFSLPLPAKWSWYVGAHLHTVAPIGLAAALTSGIVYLGLAWQRYAAYQSWLDATYADRESARLTWLEVMLGSFGIALASSILLSLYAWTIRPISYAQRLPVVAIWAVLAYALGMLGWRYGTAALPSMVAQSDAAAETAPPMHRPRADYEGLMRSWTTRALEEGWEREGDLTALTVAARLHVSPRTFSRTLAEGGGLTFNAFINGLRLQAVIRALHDDADSRDLLDVALDAGFQSKASFNRVFRRAVGVSPSAYRAHSRLTNRQKPQLAENGAQPAA